MTSWQGTLQDHGVTSLTYPFNTAHDITELLPNVALTFRILLLIAYGPAKRCIYELCLCFVTNAMCRSTLLAMSDLHLHLSEFAVLTDEASANFHFGTDDRDDEALQAMVFYFAKALP